MRSLLALMKVDYIGEWVGYAHPLAAKLVC